MLVEELDPPIGALATVAEPPQMDIVEVELAGPRLLYVSPGAGCAHRRPSRTA